tara:strand:- start:5167 stop:5499 length:333 start_codon:yes stop_codon:yes gene_type:complete
MTFPEEFIPRPRQINEKKDNILEIISQKLEGFSKKRELLLTSINEKKENSLEIKSILFEQQELLNNTEISITECEKEVEKLNVIILEIQSGYDNIVESGNCLMSIVKNSE